MRMCHFWVQNGPFVLNNFLLVKTIIITFIYLLALFTVQNFKKFLQWPQSYEDAPFLGPKWSICLNFFWKIINKIFMYLLAPFILQNFKKIVRADPELRGVPFSGPKWSLCPEQNIFDSTNHYRTFIYLLALFTVQNSKKFWQRIQSYVDASFLGLKWSIFPKQFFFGKLLILFSSTY